MPQNRERIFIVGHFGGKPGRTIFPIKISDGGFNPIQLTKVGEWEGVKWEQGRSVYSSNGLHPTITTKYHIVDTPKIHHKGRVRIATPLERFRMQGFPDEFYYKAVSDGVSNAQLNKQAGNSITVNIAYEISKSFE